VSGQKYFNITNGYLFLSTHLVGQIYLNNLWRLLFNSLIVTNSGLIATAIILNLRLDWIKN